MTLRVLSVQARSDGGARTRVQTRDHTWFVDEPKPFGGDNTAPSPVEMLLGALAGCICAVGNLAAREMGLAPGGVTLQLNGDIDSSRFLGESQRSRTGFSCIRVDLEVPPDWSAEQRQRWLEQVLDRCPLIDNLLFPTPLEIHITDPLEAPDA